MDEDSREKLAGVGQGVIVELVSGFRLIEEQVGGSVKRLRRHHPARAVQLPAIPDCRGHPRAGVLREGYALSHLRERRLRGVADVPETGGRAHQAGPPSTAPARANSASEATGRDRRPAPSSLGCGAILTGISRRGPLAVTEVYTPHPFVGKHPHMPSQKPAVRMRLDPASLKSKTPRSKTNEVPHEDQSSYLDFRAFNSVRFRLRHRDVSLCAPRAVVDVDASRARTCFPAELGEPGSRMHRGTFSGFLLPKPRS